MALTATALAVAAAAGTAALSSAAFAPQQRVNMKVLLLADTAGDPDASAWEDALKREGTPYDRINGTTTLTATTLADGDTARYQAVITSGANGTLPGGRPSGFSDEEWALLRAFESKFGIRQLDVNAYPGPPLGLNFPGSTGALDGMRGSLTAAGRAQFTDLAGVVPFDNNDPAGTEVFGYGAAGCNAADAGCAASSYEPLLQGAAGTTFAGTSLLGIAKMKDGRQQMIASFSANQFQTHSRVLRHAMLSWVTGGVFIGLNRSYLSVDVDDVFLPDDKWNPDTNTTPETAPGQQDLRMTAADVTRLVQFQNARGIKLNMLFNGAGVAEAQEANGGVDALFNAFMAGKAQFPWVNHTFTHQALGAPNPGPAPSQATIRGEISQNVQFATTNALPGFDRTTVVTGEHSGIGTSNPLVAANPNMAPALTAEGITAIGADNSRETGQRQLGSALTLPRYPMNVFYNVSTWADQLDEYDWLYLDRTAAPAGRGNCVNSATTTCFETPVTQAQFIDREAAAVLHHMLGNDPRPHYAHQSNLIADPTNANVANRGDGILYAVIGEAVDRYRSYFRVPLQQPGMNALTEELRRRVAWANTSSAQVNGYIQGGKVTIVSNVSRHVPITGTTVGDLYGGQRSGWLAVASGTTTFDITEPRTPVAPVIPGPGTTPPADTSPPARPSSAGTPTRTKRSTARPPFSCKVKRAKRTTVACTLRSTVGKPKTARIRAVRGKKVLGTASGRVRRGNQVPVLRLKRTAKRYSTRITITVKLANGKSRVLTRTLKL